MTINIGDIVFIVIGLSQWLKTKLKLQDTAAEIMSFVVGAVLGGAYQYVITKPTDLATWLPVVVVAIGMGLVPSGLYKFVSVVAEKFKTPTE